MAFPGHLAPPGAALEIFLAMASPWCWPDFTCNTQCNARRRLSSETVAPL